jgi:hypothetical protein
MGDMSLLVLVAIGPAHLLLRWWINRKARQDAAVPDSDARWRRGVARSLQELLPPLARA